MKHIKFFLAALWLVTTVTCAIAVKRPTEIHFMQVDKGQEDMTRGVIGIFCHYDTTGRLERLQFVNRNILAGTPPTSDSSTPPWLKMDTVSATLSWHKDSVTISGFSPILHDPYRYTYVLDNGRASARTGEEYQQRFFYNADGELTDVMYRYGRNDMATTTFARGNGNVTGINGDVNCFWPCLYGFPYDRWDVRDNSNEQFGYGETTNPAGIDFLLLETMPYDNQVMTLACIDGKHSANLPASRKADKYTYELDADGYPVKITVPYRMYSTVVELNYATFPDDPGSVSGIESDAADFTINGRTVSAAEGEPIRAYDLQGRTVASSATGSLTLPAPGVYILRCDTKAMKAVVR